MNCYIGLDIGTSSVKGMLISETEILRLESRDYPVYYPQPGWSEQNPEDWYAGCIDVLKKLTAGFDKSSVRAISFSGQMHGLVMLDGSDAVIRPAILWNDGRSAREVEFLNNEIGRDFLLDNTGNIAFAGFTAPKLLWVRNNERANFDRAAKICLPKDYIAYRFSGCFATDTSDAAGTLYFNTEKRAWSEPMLDLIGISEEKLPRVFESSKVIGSILPGLARELELPEDVKIVIGAGDNAASAIGTGTLENGACNISLGTSGTVFVCADKYACDRNNAIHTFCSANGKYHYLACTLSAASARKWWNEDILHTGYSESFEAYAGKSNVIFLPYLMGERSPVNDTAVRGMFANLSAETTPEEMEYAVMEGVAFSLKQNVELKKSLGNNITCAGVCGGGARSRGWLEMLACILDMEIRVPLHEHGGVLGACLLAAKGDGKDITAFYGVKGTILPDAALAVKYKEKYNKYLLLYPAAKLLVP